MVVAWKPTELQGHVSRYFQNNIGVKTSYSHLSLLVYHNNRWHLCESTFDETYIQQVSLSSFVLQFGRHVDLYVFSNYVMSEEQLVANIDYITVGAPPTTHASLYRALIGFNREGHQACSSYVLDCLGLMFDEYCTVGEAIVNINLHYKLEAVYTS